jgi:hypothetical protein
MKTMIPPGGFYYLASPYSKHPGGLEVAFRQACEAAALLIKAGVPVFSPIAHSHPIAVAGGLDPLSYDVWLPADRPMMDAASGIIVLHLLGWATSYGIAEEQRHFAAAGKPEVHMMPGQVPTMFGPVT